jgi:nicotinate-nucleotide--dimethylbenzimidazole phosphoribosyltransferase
VTTLHDLLDTIPQRNETAEAAVSGRAGEVLRPHGALARLDAVAAWVAAWQGTDRPAVERPTCVVFGADHGIAAAGVRLLDHLGLTPLLRLEMRLGEASGAMAALPLARTACAAVVEVPTFGEWFG